MKTVAAVFAMLLLAATIVAAQNEGNSTGSNFSAATASAACTISDGTGALSPGLPVASLTTDISTSSTGNTLVVRPSLVTGLLATGPINSSVTDVPTDLGIQVCVTVDGSGAGVKPNSCVIYDQRYQEVSAGVFDQLNECVTTTACGTNLPACPASFTCSVTSGSGVCLNDNCNSDLLLTTLSAHSFDFIVPAASGKHVVMASWSTVGNPNPANGVALSCVGPGVLTATQVKE